MRISNTQIAHLESLISKREGLTVEHFEVSRQDEVVRFKYRADYFSFKITKKDSDRYEITISSVSRKDPVTALGGWDSVLNHFDTWTSQIRADASAVLQFNKTRPGPSTLVMPDIPEMIKKLSKRFEKVVNQAYQAEQMGLDEICGLGFRKAFEILIKDYLIKKNPKEETEAIKKMPIMQCINKYVTDDGIKVVAHRVLWLGNDQAHYMKVYKTKNVKDLKRLIHLAITWINTHEELLRLQKMAEKVEKELPYSKTKA